MKTIKNNVLGVEVNIQVPDSVEEFDQLAKKPGACLEEAVNNVKYRGWNAEYRDTFLHGRAADEAKGLSAIKGVEDVSGIERKTEAVTDKEGKPIVKDGVETTKYAETEGKYFDRVCAEMNVKPDHFATLAQSVADQITFDPSQTEHKPGPKKLPKDIAEKGTAKVAQGEEAFAKVAKVIGKDLGEAPITWTGDAAKDADALGWKIKAHLAWKAKQSLDKY